MDKKHTVLIVDDTPENLHVMGAMLEEAGYEVRIATSGSEALHDAAKIPPELILLDIMMPEMDGFEVCRRLKAHDELRLIPVIFISALGMTEQKLQAFHEGAVDYISKPFQAEEVVARVNTHIQLAQMEEFKREIAERKQKEGFLEFLAETFSGTEDESFFNKLARYLAGSLDMDFVCIDRLEGDGLTARTLAVWSDGRFEGNVTYALKDTPCGEVVGKEVCCYPASVCQLFPRDQVLKDLRAESYVGVTLWSHAGRPIGLIAVIGRTPLKDTTVAQALLKLVAVRSAGELERLDAEEVLRTSEERYRRITEGLTDYLYSVLVEKGHVTETTQSPACEKVTGYTLEEFAADPYLWIEMVVPEDRPLVEERVDQLVKGMEIPPIEHRIIRKDGEVRWVRDTTIPFKDASGNLLSYDGMIQDITERKQREAYGQMSREVLLVLNEPGDLQESVRHVLEVLKMRTGFDAVGMRLQSGDDYPYIDQLGFSEEFVLKENSLTGRDADDGFFRDSDGNVSLEGACGLVISGRTDPANPLFTRGGSCWTNDSSQLLSIPAEVDPRFHPRNECVHQGYASLALMPIRNKERIVGLLQFNDRRKGRFTIDLVEILEVIATNIGAGLMHRRDEEEKARLEGQLHQAQKMESVGRLAGGVAHDFNNLLTIILGYAQLSLLRMDQANPLHEYLQSIQKAAEKSADLTQQLLAFARKQTIMPEVLDLNATLAGMIKMLKRLIGEDIDLTWQQDANLWRIKMDPSQVDQILANLCVNARDAIAGVGRITIETGNSLLDKKFCAHHVGSAPGEYVRLSVCDTGCGMDKETLASIFEPFFTTKEAGKGTGLGLATVYGIAKQNNGFIDVISEPGSGTTFTIYLPRHQGKEGVAASKDEKKSVPHGQETILLVEDEQEILKMTTVMLTNLGYTVLAANSPGEAIRMATDHAGGIQLLLTDVVMPEENGADLAKKLLSIQPQLKTLFMSGYTADIIANRGVLEEGIHFIKKPFSRTGLADRLREVLDK